jgi:hypothetical protein
MGGKSLIDEQRLAPTHGMGAYDRMRRLRKDLAAIVAAHQHIGRTIDVLARMRSRESFEIGLHARRQRVVGGILATRKKGRCMMRTADISANQDPSSFGKLRRA